MSDRWAWQLTSTLWSVTRLPLSPQQPGAVHFISELLSLLEGEGVGSHWQLYPGRTSEDSCAQAWQMALLDLLICFSLLVVICVESTIYLLQTAMQ